ncbi:hypothetical protein AVR91_0200230 [Amycolatopsis keratiniphila subsp. keratiniphila]|uniref:Uncharacterized protein n=1 Tax=Amycolatopsis keratiniphila subsp. keratiniphila TaxID=227715 RepID=A0A1W2M4W3_9PSEU|nr:hypothetical protein AVR91_0200230 [Amycolatopsis keratiniphila subsp. keratiniphila]
MSGLRGACAVDHVGLVLVLVLDVEERVSACRSESLAEMRAVKIMAVAEEPPVLVPAPAPQIGGRK